VAEFAREADAESSRDELSLRDKNEV
jgi:hypothetical protein